MMFPSEQALKLSPILMPLMLRIHHIHILINYADKGLGIFMIRIQKKDCW